MQLLCVGDVALADGDLPREAWVYLLGRTPGNEIRILLNWELPIGETINPTPRSSGPRLLAHPASLRVVQAWAPGFATLATNHILDGGEEGLTSTITSLNHTGFTTVGAGRTEEEIQKPLFWETAEGRLAIVNWVFPETHPDWMAVPGPNCWPGPQEAQKSMAKARREADWVMVIAHWSDEYFAYPRPEDRGVARELAQMGANIIVGHHPHVVRGMELIGSCPVFYSVGNFYFEETPDDRGGRVSCGAPRSREGLGVDISFRRGCKPEWTIQSFWQMGSQTVLDPSRRAARRMEQVNRPLKQFPHHGYTEWYSKRRTRFDRWDYRWHFGLWKSRKTRHLTRFLRDCQRQRILR